MGLLDDGADGQGDVKVVDHAWRGAEAFHFLMLCQVRLKTIHTFVTDLTMIRQNDFHLAYDAAWPDWAIYAVWVTKIMAVMGQKHFGRKNVSDKRH